MPRSSRRIRVYSSDDSSIPTELFTWDRKQKRHAEPTDFRVEGFVPPIPWEWICKAARFSGKALQVALGLWLLNGLRRGGKLKLHSWVLEDLGVSSKRAGEALARLEAAGLVRVERKRGRLPVVEVQDPNATPAPPTAPAPAGQGRARGRRAGKGSGKPLAPGPGGQAA